MKWARRLGPSVDIQWAEMKWNDDQISTPDLIESHWPILSNLSHPWRKKSMLLVLTFEHVCNLMICCAVLSSQFRWWGLCWDRCCTSWRNILECREKDPGNVIESWLIRDLVRIWFCCVVSGSFGCGTKRCRKTTSRQSMRLFCLLIVDVMMMMMPFENF